MDPTIQRPYKRRLRSVLIHKPIQREFTLVVMMLLFISALTIGFVIHSTIRHAMMGGGYRFGTISPYEVMSDVSYNLIVRVSLVLFVTILIITVFGVFFLHRIAGPVYRFQNVLRKVGKGELPEEFKLREGDFFVETAQDLNSVLKILKNQQVQLTLLAQKVDRLLEENSIPESEPVIREMKEVLSRMMR